jgi:uncharacterized protein (DUF697 family)
MRDSIPLRLTFGWLWDRLEDGVLAQYILALHISLKRLLLSMMLLEERYGPSVSPSMGRNITQISALFLAVSVVLRRQWYQWVIFVIAVLISLLE